MSAGSILTITGLVLIVGLIAIWWYVRLAARRQRPAWTVPNADQVAAKTGELLQNSLRVVDRSINDPVAKQQYEKYANEKTTIDSRD